MVCFDAVSRMVSAMRGTTQSATPRAGAPSRVREGASHLMPLAGLGFWQAWWMCVSSTNAVIGPVQRAVPAILVILATTLAGYVLAVLFAPRLAPYGRRRALVLASGACGAFGTLCMWMATHFDSPLPVATFLEWSGGLLVAAFSSLVLIMWGERWSTLAAGNVGRQLVCSFALAFALYFGVWALGGIPGVALVCAFPPLSAASLIVSWAEPARTDTPVSALELRPRTLAPLLVALALISVAFGAVQHVGLVRTDGLGQVLSMLVAGALTAAFAAFMLARRSVGDPFSFYRPIVPAIACGMIACLLLDERGSYLGNGAVVFGIYCMDMFVMFASSDLAYRSRRPVAVVFGSAIAATRAGTLAGSLLGSAAEGVLAQAPALRLPAMLCLLAVVVLAGTTVLTEARLRAAYQPASAPRVPDLADRCAQLARDGRLTARELEVMRLLAQGRSIAVIGEQLGIAPGTVKHHASNTYRKLGIYDRQELIDLVSRSDGE